MEVVHEECKVDVKLDDLGVVFISRNTSNVYRIKPCLEPVT